MAKGPLTNEPPTHNSKTTQQATPPPPPCAHLLAVRAGLTVDGARVVVALHLCLVLVLLAVDAVPPLIGGLVDVALIVYMIRVRRGG